MPLLCVAHLVRKSEGMGPFESFIRSYEQHPAGMNHQLMFAFKGFGATDNLADYRRLLVDIEHDAIFLPDRGFDIGSYARTVRAVRADSFCFLNSHSVILAPDWLALMYEHATDSGVGAVGATGSWESFYTDYRRGLPDLVGFSPLILARRVRRSLKLAILSSAFDPFPNPHLRTNAFVMSRDTISKLNIGRMRTKMDVSRFESGKHGMTRQLARSGHDVLVVGRDGKAYEQSEWLDSHTFRSGDQANLLVGDNRTRQYSAADPKSRAWLAQLAWGAAEG